MNDYFLSIPEPELKKLIKTALEELIKEKPEMFIEILEDYALGKAIGEGLKTYNVSEEKVFKVLNEIR